MNAKLTKAMAQMMQVIVKKLNGVRGGLDLKHQHDSTGRIARDASGNKIVTQEAVAGFAAQVLDIEDSMVTDMMDVEVRHRLPRILFSRLRDGLKLLLGRLTTEWCLEERKALALLFQAISLFFDYFIWVIWAIWGFWGAG